MNKYESQYQTENNTHPLKMGCDIYMGNYIGWLQDKLSDCDHEYVEACHKEIEHLKKYTAHLIDCDKTQGNDKKCSCGLE